MTEELWAALNLENWRGNPEARLMIVGEAPLQSCELAGVPFSGRDGRRLDALLARLGLGAEDVFILAAPPRTCRTGMEVERVALKVRRARLRSIVLACKPRAALALGTHATRILGFDSVASVRGDVLMWDAGAFQIPVVYSWHPTQIRKARHGEKTKLEEQALKDLQLAWLTGLNIFETKDSK